MNMEYKDWSGVNKLVPNLSNKSKYVVFGKTMENLRKRINFELINNATI